MFLSWKFELFVHISPSCQDCPSSPSCTGPGGTQATRDGCDAYDSCVPSNFEATQLPCNFGGDFGWCFWSYPHLFLFGRWNMMEYDGILMISGGCQFSSCLQRWMVRDCTISSLGAARSQENMAHSAVALQWHVHLVHLPFGNHFSDLASIWASGKPWQTQVFPWSLVSTADVLPQGTRNFMKDSLKRSDGLTCGSRSSKKDATMDGRNPEPVHRIS